MGPIVKNRFSNARHYTKQKKRLQEKFASKNEP